MKYTARHTRGRYRGERIPTHWTVRSAVALVVAALVGLIGLGGAQATGGGGHTDSSVVFNTDCAGTEVTLIPGSTGDPEDYDWKINGEDVMGLEHFIPSQINHVKVEVTNDKLPGAAPGPFKHQWKATDTSGCVDFEVVEECGGLGVNLINKTNYHFEVRALVDATPAYSVGEGQSSPVVLEEDASGGIANVALWVEGAESDFLVGSGVPNFWDQNATTVLVSTDCEGTPGDDGQDGNDGSDGSDGQDGSDGADGSDGQDGADGEVTTVTNTVNVPTRINTGK